MTDMQAIAARRSRRAYRGPVGDEAAHRLEHWAAQLNLENGLFIELRREGGAVFAGLRNSYGLFSGVHSLLVLAGRADDADLDEKVGHAGQRLVLEAVKMGLGSCWVGGTFDRQQVQSWLVPGHRAVAVITVGPVKVGGSLMGRAAGRISGGRRKRPQQMMDTDSAPPEWFVAGVAAAAAAPSALGRQPVRFAWQAGVASARVPEDRALQRVDLGIAKLHFEIAAGGRFATGNGAAFEKAPDE
ncbi:MAG: nitroreductase family protein [Oscillospiraceae bacterium]